MGRGGAQLGKSIKGKSKDRRKARHVGAAGAVDVNGVEVGADGQQAGGDVAADLRALEEYERLAANSELHRRRMNEIARQERQYHSANARLLHRIYRQWRRKEKTAEMRLELEVLAANHTADVQRKNRCIANMQQAITAAHTQSNSRHSTYHTRAARHSLLQLGVGRVASQRLMCSLLWLPCLRCRVAGCALPTAVTSLTSSGCTPSTAPTSPPWSRTSTPPLTLHTAVSLRPSSLSVSSTL